MGSYNRIKMGDLKSLLKSIGLKNVQTYLASGNVVFETEQTDKEELSNKISTKIDENHGFEPPVFVLSPKEITQAANSNPFPDAESDPKSLHLGFLVSKPEKPDLKKLEQLKKENERFKLTDKVFYLHAPDGIGRSKLAAGSEKALGVSMTDRNWRTVKKVIDMAAE